MTHTWPEVNAAVMAVLAEFGRAGRDQVRPRPVENIFVDRLFGLRHAEAAGEGTIQVAVGTVITPMAQELLRRRGIAIRVVSADRSSRRGEWGLAIDSKSGLVDAFRRTMLSGDGYRDVGQNVDDATGWLIQAETRGAMLVVDEASTATFRASRVEGVRPATVSEPEAVSRAVRTLGANLIVIEPTGKSIYQLKQIGERFRLSGAPAQPGAWS